MIKKITLLSALFFMCMGLLQAQILVDENFELGFLPNGWTVSSDATDDGWVVGAPNVLSGGGLSIPNNGSNLVVGTNDGTCDCDKANDFLILPPQDLTNAPAAELEFDVYFRNAINGGIIETGKIQVSTDGGTTWESAKSINGGLGWNTQTADLSGFVGNSNVLIAFHYNDNGGSLFGMAIDNVVLSIPLGTDAEMGDATMPDFGETDTEYGIRGLFTNKGASTITSIEITYDDDSGNPVAGTIDGLNVETDETATFQHPTPWIPTTTGTVTIPVRITAVNGMPDELADNNETDILRN